MRVKGADGVSLYSLKDMIEAFEMVRNRQRGAEEENERTAERTATNK
jgi:hypothetical protein